MSALDPESVARAIFKCYVDKDRKTAESLIAKDFHFTSPLDNRLNRTSYFERCWPNSEHAEKFDFKHVVVTGDQVFVTYEAKFKGEGIFRNTELLTIRNGQLLEAEVYFGWTVPHEAPAGGFLEE